MSSCANIINRLVRDVCNLQKELDKSECMRSVLELNQSIFRRSDSTAYVLGSGDVADCGIPVCVDRKEGCCESSYSGLLVAETTDPKAVLVNTGNLHKCGKRECSGFFCFTKTLHLCVQKVDLDVLKNLDQATLVAALQHCSTTTNNRTLTLEAYNALLGVLANYGIKSISVTQAACVYDYLMNKKSCDDEEEKNEPAEPAEPAEPYEPSEPSDLYPDIQVRQLSDTTVSDPTTSNEQIENKLRLLLEQTETNTE